MADCDPFRGHSREADMPKLAPSAAGAYTQEATQLIEIDSGRNVPSMHITQPIQTRRGRLRSVDSISTAHQPPVNFSKVSEGLYRSGYPQTADYPFIQTLNLKTIVTLVNDELPDGYQSFIRGNGITHRIFDMAGTKKQDIPIELMRSIIRTVSDTNNYPLLIHCNHGRHRTGCVVGVFRKSSQWDVKHIIEEYTTFAEPKVREVDLKYLASFELTTLLSPGKPQALAAPTNSGRFFGFIIITVLALFAFYPLSKFRVQESRPETS